MAGLSQRHALGGLFLLLAAALAAVAVAAGRAGQWVIAVAAAIIALWLGGLGVRALKPR